MANEDGFLTGRGMSWNIRPRKGHFQISHGGSQAETRTYLLIFPLEHFAVAIASNLETFDREFYAYKLAELVLEEDLDTPVYVADELEESIFLACEQAFSYGLSHYYWHARTLARNEKDLEEAFDFFNHTTTPASMRQNIQKTKNNLSAGIHPAAGQAFTKVGSFMAAQLEKAYGRNKLKDYHKTGPTVFFMDYVALSQASPGLKHKYQLKRRLSQMLFQWEKEWLKMGNGKIGLLYIPLDIAFDRLQDNLKTAFSSASVYPDVHEDLIRVAQFHLKNTRIQQASSFLELAHELYPNRVSPMTALASLHLWTGKTQEAGRLYHKAFAKDPNHNSLSIDQFQGIARDLIRAKKKDNLTDLAEIVTELYPDSAGIFRGLGDMFYNIGQRDTALHYYKKALKLDRKLKDVRDRIKILEKERKK
jgi:tetratricopeptide (TPR) repeat protein